MNRNVCVQVVGVVFLSLMLAGIALAQEGTATSDYPASGTSEYHGSELLSKRWTAGGGMGLLGSTPDDTAFAVNGNADYFVNEHFSIGPLVQLGFTDDMTMLGVSGQGKYWITSPLSGDRGQLYLQSGLGFAHADFRADDSSWLVPIGIGYDYALTPGVNLTSAFLVNFTDLNTGAGSGADVMPGFTVGLRF